jgi:hypothetical protein
VCLAAILLIGLGGAAVWQVFRPRLSYLRVGVAVVAMLLILSPAVAERMSFYSDNTLFLQRSMDAVNSDADAQAIIQTVSTLPAGRVYAGLPATYGNEMRFGDLAFYNLLPFYGIESLAPPTESMSLNADFIWDFDDKNQDDFDLFNVRYLIAPANMAVADFLTPIKETSKYTLDSAPTSGFAEYVAIASRQAVLTQSALFQINLAWERTHTLPAEREYTRFDYPATVEGSGPSSGAACPGGGKTDFKLFQASRIDLVVECPADSTLVIKTTYHPNWQVSVDGVVAPDFMVSPSYIGVTLPAGKHTVNAIYQATPIKAPVIVLGAFTALLLLILRARLDRFAERIRVPRRKREALREDVAPPA